MQTQLKIRTEYSFRTAYGPVEKVVDRLAMLGCKSAAITDRNSTFGHVAWSKQCKKRGIKPLFGVELSFTPDITVKERRQNIFWATVIAKSQSGLQEIYSAIEESAKGFYRIPRLPTARVSEFTSEVIVLLNSSWQSVRLNDVSNKFSELHPYTNRLEGMQSVAISDNYMIETTDRSVYEAIAGRFAFNRPSPMHILERWDFENPDEQAFLLGARLAEECSLDIPVAENVKVNSDVTLKELCLLGAKRRKLELNDVYMARLDRELGVIQEKQFEDYFFVLADLISWSKQHMLIGPARGSSAGSLVCYLTGITDIDPIPHDLIFERFIDITRKDLPDIDVDFQDNKRDLAFQYLSEKYGAENVARLGTISRYKPKSAIGKAAGMLNIPPWETTELKNSILDRSTGDSRANFCIADTLQETDIGKTFLKKYPAMIIASKLEAHASHHGMHAAGVVITARPLSNFVSRDVRSNTIQIDKRDAEDINLLKIDALGLKTLSIIADCLDSVGMAQEELLSIPLDCDEAFAVLRNKQWCGIFQFEGNALQSIASRIDINRFTDISALTALARPGPFASGASGEWINRRMGLKPVDHFHPITETITSETYGLVIYQEQVMQIAREVGLLSWEETSTLRKAMSKSLGVEFFDQFWARFRTGALSQGFDETLAKRIWDNINTMGSWAFNKCLSKGTKVRLAYSGSNSNNWETIEFLYERYVENPTAWTKYRKPILLSLFPDGRIYPQKVKNIFRNGNKDVNAYSFSDGTIIKCTSDHKFIIDGEWKPIADAHIGSKFVAGQYEMQKWIKRGQFNQWTDPYANNRTIAKRNFRAENQNRPCYECGSFHQRMEIHHADLASGKSEPNDLRWLCPGCHKKHHYSEGRTKLYGKGFEQITIELIKIENADVEMTYDIEMEEHSNFMIEGGIITHNSHSVAYGMLSYWCCYLKAKYPMKFALAYLKHTREGYSVVRYLRELDRNGQKFVPFDYYLSEKDWSLKNDTLIGGFSTVKGIGAKTADLIVELRAKGKDLPQGVEMKLLEPVTEFDNVFEARRKFSKLLSAPQEFNIKSKMIELIDIGDDKTCKVVFIAKVIDRNQRSLNETIFLAKRNGMKVPNHLWLNLVLEDDTATIPATVGRFHYESLGKPLLETYKVGDWFIFKGNVKQGQRRVFVERYRLLQPD